MVEMLIIAPIVILMIGGFIAVFVSMTGEVLATRSSNVLAYNIQDATNRIEQDVKLSTTFLEANHVALTSPQGFNDDTTNFSNVDVTNGNMLILNTLLTTGNPLASSSGLVYLTNQPNACASSQVNQNTPMTMNVIYFIRNGTLWRRTVLPANYATAGCSVPWQQPSCTAIGGFCVTKDIDLIDGITTSGFTLQYFNTADATIANTIASDTSQSAAARYAALQTTATVGATINVTQTAGGRNITQTGSIRATKLATNASSIAVVAAATTPAAPTVTAVATPISLPASAVVTWPTVPGASTYTMDYNINGGGWVNGLTNSTATTYTVTAATNNVVNIRVSASNSAGTSAYGTTSITITPPAWTSLVLQNSWTDYNGTFANSSYTKTSDGMVVLKGLIKRTGVPVAGETIGVLPVGYRPLEELLFETGSNSVASRTDILPDGRVMFETGNAVWLSLDGINFMTSSTTFNALTPLINGWVIYSAPTYATPAYAVDTSGRVHVKGLIKSGVSTDPTIVVTLPVGARPPSYEHIAVDNSNNHGQIGFDSTGTIAVKGGGNSFVSLQAMFYPAAYGGWTTLPLQNGWVWYGTVYSAPRYTKSADGMVLVKGLIHSGSVVVNSVIANLPVGYRPSQRLLLTSTSAAAYGRIDVMPTGDIIVGGPLSATWASMDAISFMAEQ